MNPLAILLVILALSLSLISNAAAEETSAAAADLKDLVGRISDKLKAGQSTPEALAPEIAEFDALLAKYPEKNDETGGIAFTKAMLYAQLLRDEETAKSLFAAIEDDFPGTEAAANAKRALFQLSPEGKAAAKAEEEARKAKLAALEGQPAPEIDFNWSTRKGLAKLSDLEGQVVVLDFWATWCGPCIDSFPQVRKEVEHFKGAPVTFLGVTSLQGRVSGLSTGKAETKGDPELEYTLTRQFMEEKNMTWDVAFSEQSVFNPDYAIRGIPSVAIIAPDGMIRHFGLHPGNPNSDIAGKVTALLKEFNLPLPAAKN